MRALILLLPLVLGGCDATDFATPEERAALEAGAQDVDAKAKAEKDATERAGRALEALLQNGTPEAVAEAQAALDALTAAGLELTEAISQYEAVHGPIRDRVVENGRTILLPFLPPPFNGPLGVVAGQLAAMLAFGRSRKHLGKAAGSALKGQLADAISAALRAAGMLHSSKQSEFVANKGQT